MIPTPTAPISTPDYSVIDLNNGAVKSLSYTVKSSGQSFSPVNITLQEDSELKNSLQSIINKYPAITQASIVAKDLSSGRGVVINGDYVYTAASAGKLFPAVFLLRMVDSGDLRSDNLFKGNGFGQLDMNQLLYHLLNGRGTNYYSESGQIWTFLKNMISLPTIQDSASAWQATSYNAEDNTITPRAMLDFLTQVEKSNILQGQTKSTLYNVLQNTNNDSLIAKGAQGYTTIHKWGLLSDTLVDTGLIQGKGKSVAVAIFTKGDTKNFAIFQEATREIVQKLIENISSNINTNPPGGNITPSNCKAKELDPYLPQPQHLDDNELCNDGSLAKLFSPSYTPANLVNLRTVLGSKYLLLEGLSENNQILVKDAMVNDLKKLLDYITDKYNQSGQSACIPAVAYGYRSFALQQQLYDKNNCIWDPETASSVVKDQYGKIPQNKQDRRWCGAGRPGGSTHQSGLAVDLYCAKLTCSDQSNCKIDLDYNRSIKQFLTNVEMNNFGFIKSLPQDTPHYEYFR
ncbi:serine hydrolase [Candidatus Roizmanbacteria bacterium]|nr:serine hydrolase [Candidatus Roizmanbacteria bacterium]